MSKLKQLIERIEILGCKVEDKRDVSYGGARIGCWIITFPNGAKTTFTSMKELKRMMIQIEKYLLEHSNLINK